MCDIFSFTSAFTNSEQNGDFKMKKRLLLLLSVICITLLLTACAGEDIDLCLHEWEQVVSDEYLISPQTCDSAAKYYSVCKLCGATDVPFTYGEFREHSFVKNPDSEYCRKKATCFSYAEYVESCEHCGLAGENTFTYGTMLAHTKGEAMNEETLLERPTCTTPALYQYSCAVCNQLITETFNYGPMLPHTDVHGDYICDLCEKPLKRWEDDIPSGDMADIDRWD